MSDRTAQLRRRIAFYRKRLREGVSAEVAQQHLAAISELEAELSRVESSRSKPAT